MKKLIIIALMVLIGCFPVAVSRAAAQTLVPFAMMPDSAGHPNTQVGNASRFINHYALTARTARPIAVPIGAKWVNFNAQANLWVNFSGGTAVIPSADVTDGSGSQYNPPMTYIGPISSGGVITYPALGSISVISDTAWTMTPSWFQ